MNKQENMAAVAAKRKEMNDKRGTNNEIAQQQNRLLVLRQIKEKKITSRIEVAQITGLQQATITNIVNDLIRMEYVCETGLIEGTKGRRVTGIQLNEDKMRVLCVRVTTSYFAAGIYDVYGTCIEVQKEFTNAYADFGATLRKITEVLEAYCAANAARKILGITVSMDGVEESVWRSHLLPEAPDNNLRLVHLLEAQFHVPVYVDKCSNMAGYYEWDKKERKQQKLETLLCLMVGYTVDSAIVSNGHIVKGRRLICGDFGHTTINYDGPLCACGGRGCINNYISVNAVLDRVAQKKSQYPQSPLTETMNIREILKAYYDKDAFALDIYAEVAHYLAIVIANQINAIDPNEVIFGDEIPNSDSFVELVRREVSALLPAGRADDVIIKAFKEARITQNDVAMKGACRYLVKMQFKKMKLE